MERGFFYAQLFKAFFCETCLKLDQRGSGFSSRVGISSLTVG